MRMATANGMPASLSRWAKEWRKLWKSTIRPRSSFLAIPAAIKSRCMASMRWGTLRAFAEAPGRPEASQCANSIFNKSWGRGTAWDFLFFVCSSGQVTKPFTRSKSPQSSAAISLRRKPV
jgi:hypothetical protein